MCQWLGAGAAAGHQRSFISASFLLFYLSMFVCLYTFKVKSGKKPIELMHPCRLDSAGEV